VFVSICELLCLAAVSSLEGDITSWPS
jgi:hypothetical protein